MEPSLRRALVVGWVAVLAVGWAAALVAD